MSDSRVGLPDLSSDYALSEAQIAAFQKDGYAILRGRVCSADEISAYRDGIEPGGLRAE